MLLSFAIVFLFGVCILQILPDLSITKWVYSATVVGVFSYFILQNCKCFFASKGKKFAKIILLYGFIFLLGASYALYHANLYLAHKYPEKLQKQPITVIGKVVSIPDYKHDKVSFNFAMEKILQPTNSGIKPGLMHLSWDLHKKLQLGQTWQFTVRLKKPRGFANVGCFDTEKYYFSKRIIAIGYVITKHYKQRYVAKRIYKETAFFSIYNFGQATRQYLYEHIMQALQNKPFQGIILALVTGVQHRISPMQFEVFKDTGVEHLLAIAGLHIGFMAGLAFFIARTFWCYMPRQWLKIPAHVVGAYGAIIVAFGYAYLAGFSISTQRACIMVIIAMLGIILRRTILPADIFAYALFLVLLLDPFVVLSLSFWLSFVAVAILFYAFIGRKARSRFDKWVKPSIATTIGMMPLLLAGFSTLPLISPIANLIAIPWVSWFVLPIALLGALIHPFWQQAGVQLWSLAELILQWLWPVLQTLQQLPWSQWQPIIVSPWCLGLAFIGALWLLAPKGFPGRIFGLCGFFSLFFPLVTTIPEGEVNFTVLDVGQGLAIVMETSKHVLIYDTGPKFAADFDAGEQIVWPFLRANNIRHINTIVVSHADLDHSGGMQALIRHLVPQQILTPKPELLLSKMQTGSDFSVEPILPIVPCIAGQHWEWDGVEFAMLHPIEPLPWARNEQSCVLHVKTKAGSILLTGDIGYKTERQLVNRCKTELSAEIIVVPHHGSKQSSTLDLIKAVRARYAIASVGYLNQYRHPHPLIIERFLHSGAKFLDTAKCGAISLQLGKDSKQFYPSCYRIEHRRIWRDNT